MEKYVDGFISAIRGTLDWTMQSILFDVPWQTNYFWGLIIISLIVWLLEIIFPWRKNQSIFRKDFWLDGFYMFFNFFIFAIAISGSMDFICFSTFSFLLLPLVGFIRFLNCFLRILVLPLKVWRY